MINEEIIGGLVSALSRGEPLEKAMMTFFNAGYGKGEIEESAQEVYKQLGPQAMGIKGSLQDTIDEIALQAGVKEDKAAKTPAPTPNPNPNTPKDQIQLQNASDKKAPEIDNPHKDKNKVPQNVSQYGKNNFNNNQYQNADDITNKIVDAIKGIKGVSIPSRIEIVQRNIDSKPSPAVVQKVSDYSGAPQKTVGKAATYILIVVLILLLGALAAVFFFKADLIKFFNNAGLG
jgi:hypothetical protein